MLSLIELLANTGPVYDNTQATEQFKDGMWSFWGPIFKWGFGLLCGFILLCLCVLAGLAYFRNQNNAVATGMTDASTQKPGCLGFLQVLLSPPGGAAERGRWPYAKKKYLLSKAEFSFYRVLSQACGGSFVICPKVRLGDLIYVRKGTDKRMSWVNRINRSHIDFVLCDPQTMQPLAAVELDDSSHDSERAKQRDAMKDKACAAAGLPLLRFKAQRSYDPAKIAERLLKLKS